MKHADGRVTVIPVHAKENITVGLLIKIMKDAKLRKGRIHKVTCGVLKYTPLLLENLLEKSKLLFTIHLNQQEMRTAKVLRVNFSTVNNRYNMHTKTL